MSRIKNAFHDEIIWNAMDEDERQEALHYASVDTRRMAETPQDGSVRSTGSAVPNGQTPNLSSKGITSYER